MSVSPYLAPSSGRETPEARGAGPEFDPAGLFLARWGLFAIRYGVGVAALPVPVIYLLGIVSGILDRNLLPNSVLVLLGLMAVGGYLSMMLGHLLCVTVPSQTNAKGFALFAFASQLMILLQFVVIVAARNRMTSVSTNSFWVSWGALVLGIISCSLGTAALARLLLFIRQLADYVKRSDLAAKAWSLFLTTLGTGVSAFTLLCAGPFLGGVVPFVVIVFGGVLFFATAIFLLTIIGRFAVLAGNLARAIPKSN